MTTFCKVIAQMISVIFILALDNNKIRFIMKESLLIKLNKPVLKRTKKSFHLKLFD